MFFSLDAILSQNNETEQRHVADVSVFQADSVHLRQHTTGEAPTLAAVFLPSSLVESAVEDRQHLSRKLLTKVHPFLADNFTVDTIIRVADGPADLVLLDLSHSPPEIVEELLVSTNGQPLAAMDEAIVKLVLLSSVSLSTGELASTAVDLPTCPVCLYRLDLRRLGLPKPANYQLCSKFCPPPDFGTDTGCPRQRFLRPWSTHCRACAVIERYWQSPPGLSSSTEVGDLFCYRCPMQSTLWVCLTCGFIGCGRYSQEHAAEHFRETSHALSLELATLRIWDYVGGEFAHRVDLLECPCSLPKRAVYLGEGGYRSGGGGGEEVHVVDDDKSPKKATMIGEEYEALLQSALEEQAQHYEGEITRLLAALTAEQVDASRLTEEEKQEIDVLHAEIAKLRAEIDVVGQELLDGQAQEAGQRAKSQQLLREQQKTQELLKLIRRESRAEFDEGKRQIEELEQQVEDLKANQRMRQQFSQDEELANAQIFGTMESNAKARKGKGGKKSRRARR